MDARSSLPDAHLLLPGEGGLAIVRRIERHVIQVGRGSENDIVLASPGVSRRHAQITWTGEHFLISDLGSKNGTLVNGVVIGRPMPLSSGDEIEVGDAAIGFRVEPPTLSSIGDSVAETPPDVARFAPPEGIVSLLFTDIVGSAMLTEQLGDAIFQDVLRDHNAAIRSASRRHGGYEVKTIGDAFMLAFPRARPAVMCAIDIQRAISRMNDKITLPYAIDVRIGVHAGEAIREENDFFGRHVIAASRIAAHAGAREILISAVIRQIMSDARGIPMDDLGEVHLKGLSEPYRVYRVDWTQPAEKLDGRPAHAGE